MSLSVNNDSCTYIPDPNRSGACVATPDVARRSRVLRASTRDVARTRGEHRRARLATNSNQYSAILNEVRSATIDAQRGRLKASLQRQRRAAPAARGTGWLVVQELDQPTIALTAIARARAVTPRDATQYARLWRVS